MRRERKEVYGLGGAEVWGGEGGEEVKFGERDQRFVARIEEVCVEGEGSFGFGER